MPSSPDTGRLDRRRFKWVPTKDQVHHLPILLGLAPLHLISDTPSSRVIAVLITALVAVGLLYLGEGRAGAQDVMIGICACLMMGLIVATALAVDLSSTGTLLAGDSQTTTVVGASTTSVTIAGEAIAASGSERLVKCEYSLTRIVIGLSDAGVAGVPAKPIVTDTDRPAADRLQSCEMHLRMVAAVLGG